MSVPQPYNTPPIYQSQEEAREWWRWHFAGQIAGAYPSETLTMDRVAFAVSIADALIAALEKKP